MGTKQLRSLRDCLPIPFTLPTPGSTTWRVIATQERRRKTQVIALETKGRPYLVRLSAGCSPVVPKDKPVTMDKTFGPNLAQMRTYRNSKNRLPV